MLAEILSTQGVALANLGKWDRGRAIIDEARKILEEKRDNLETLAKGLLEFETLSGDEIVDLLKGKKPNRESVLEPTTPRASAVPPAGKSRPRQDPDPGLEPPPQA